MAATSSLVSLEEYLHTSYRPDCDWIEGELKERNLGEQPHAVLQAYFAFLFRASAKAWGVRVLTEQRVQVAARRYRIPDVCVLSSCTPFELILHAAPLLCIEILSREDRMGEIRQRVDEYFAMGVRAVWVVDPLRRKAYSAVQAGALESVTAELTVPETAIQIPLADIFAELDSMGAFL